MPTTRRQFLEGVASASALPVMLPRSAWADDDTALTQRLAADLARRARFGDKFSGGPGELATARSTRSSASTRSCSRLMRAHQRAIELLIAEG